MAATKQTTAERAWSQAKRKRLGPPVKGRAYAEADKARMKAEIIRLLGESATTREICELETMPTRATLFEWLQEDDEFRDAYENAKVIAANGIVDEALDYAREVVEASVDDENGPDHARARVAESYANVAMKYAEMIAPRTFGKLVKLTDASGNGPAVIQLVNFGTQTVDGEGASPNSNEPKASPST